MDKFEILMNDKFDFMYFINAIFSESFVINHGLRLSVETSH